MRAGERTDMPGNVAGPHKDDERAATAAYLATCNREGKQGS